MLTPSSLVCAQLPFARDDHPFVRMTDVRMKETGVYLGAFLEPVEEDTRYFPVRILGGNGALDFTCDFQIELIGYKVRSAKSVLKIERLTVFVDNMQQADMLAAGGLLAKHERDPFDVAAAIWRRDIVTQGIE